jgi:mannose-6-phosphate isomerase-like protein (cupin superfamily)
MLERMPPGTFELRHVHHTTRQFYYVLEGGATVDLDGEMVALSAGEGLEIPPGSAHQMRNDSGDHLEFLVMSSGPPRADRVDLT